MYGFGPDAPADLRGRWFEIAAGKTAASTIGRVHEEAVGTMTGVRPIPHNPRRHVMNKSRFGAVALIVGGVCFAVMTGNALAQAGTGPGSGVPGLGGSSSGSAMDPHKDTESRTKREPHSRTIVPDSGHSQSSQGIAEVPPGLGEKGTGQTQSTTERSGGHKSGHAESMAKSSAETGQGKTENAMKQQSKEKSNR